MVPQTTDLKQNLNGLMKLVETTCELAAQHELDDILRTVTQGACEALFCERASLFLVDEQTAELFTRTVTELEIEEIRFPRERGIAGWVVSHREMLNIPEPYNDERFNPSFDRQTGFLTRNILAAPVVSPLDDRTVGVLQILNKQGGSFEVYDENVLKAFAAHAATALERAKLLLEAKKSQELRLAFDLGRKIQTSFLPSSLPDVTGYQMAAFWQPAESVSGDYYDVLQFPDGRWGLVIADVSGHGVGPSLIMASARAMLRVMAEAGSEPNEILSLLSETIYPDLQENLFITFLIIALDPERNELVFANAGHGPVLHYHRQADEFSTLDATGLPVGVLEEIEFPPSEIVSLAPGDCLLLMTDGAFELPNAADEQFGVDRIKQLIRENRDLSAQEIVTVLRNAITAFEPHQLPPDDITLLILKRNEA
jgi:serine phosphatase RsbU (regulator of sigma subunit)